MMKQAPKTNRVRENYNYKRLVEQMRSGKDYKVVKDEHS